MGQYTLTVDDISPMISYEGNWESLTMNHPNDEAAINSFNGNTLHALNSSGSATLQFVGNDISVWGPSRLDSSRYTVHLDGQSMNTTAFGTQSNESALLYRASGLAPGLAHTLQISNNALDLRKPWLRIDKFVIESETDGGSNIETFIDDSASKINYTPNKQAWSKQNGDQSAYRGGTFHTTNLAKAALGFTTDGDIVEVYGGQNWNFSSFSVTVDGGVSQYKPNARDFQTPVLLFQTQFLRASDQHTIQIQLLEDKDFEFDFVRIMKYRESSQSSEDASASPVDKASVGAQSQTGLPSSASILPGPAVAGIVLGCLAILALVGLTLLLWSRKKRRRQLPPSMINLNMGSQKKNTPIYEEFSSVYRSQSNGTGEQGTAHCMDLLDGQPESGSAERSQYEPYLSMYKTGAVRSKYEATLRPEDSASFHVRSPPPSEVGSQIQSDYVTHFTPTVSAGLPPLSE